MAMVSDTYETAASGGPILVIDTDPGVRWSLERGLSRSGYAVRTVHTVAEAIRAVEQDRVPLVLMEVVPDAGFTLETLALLVSIGQSTVVCSSVDASPRMAVECIRRGASGFLSRPFSLANVRLELANARQVAAPGTRRASYEEHEPGDKNSLLVGSSAAMDNLRATLREVARTDLNCLIRGESGVGKDLVAREIHRLSKRREHPFVKVNCSALPEQLLESEMFGFERGAFTGANQPKPGRFGLANKGIIFLDEIGELHPSLQAKLLQVIEHKVFTRLGSRSSTKVDVQVLAATNADLEERVKTGAFRHDLFFRLNEVCIWIPPLAQRKEDISPLVRSFVQKYRRNASDSPIDITEQDLATLREHQWPGNVRELESTVKRWIALGKKDFQDIVRGMETGPKPSSVSPVRSTATGDADRSTSEEPGHARVLKVLEECQWNRRKAAAVLGVSYQVLRRLITQYGLDRH